MKTLKIASKGNSVLSAIKSKGSLLSGIFLGITLAFAGCSEDNFMNSTSGTGSFTEFHSTDAGDPSGNRNNTSVSIFNHYDDRNISPIFVEDAKSLLSQVELVSDVTNTSCIVKKAPFVANFVKGGILITVATGNLPSGKFNKIRFNIFRPGETDPIPDPEFRDVKGSFSFIIRGTFKGNSFTYRSRAFTSQVIDLSVPTITGDKSKNITLFVNSSLWFKNGDNYLNPNDPQNTRLIDNSIKNSFLKAYKDDNKDGSPDNN